MRKFNHDPRAVTQHRQDAGLTKTALAERLECSLSLVSEIESGTRNARPQLLARMAEIFGCNVAELESRREAETSTDVDVSELAVRSGERADTGRVLEVRDR